MNRQKIVIGYDGSSTARAALTWALDEADRTGAAAELVYADEWPVWAPAASMVPAPALRPDGYADEVIGGMLEHAVAAARQTHPTVPISATTVQAFAAAGLAGRSDRARMIVLGTRGHSALAGLVGSVGASVGARAHCPVVVVHGEVTGVGPVVAGVDDSPLSAAVLRFAAEQAAGHRAGLRVIRLQRVDDHHDPVGELLGSLTDEFPGLRVEIDAPPENPAAALVAAGGTARLLVVGSRGRGSVRGLLLGAVSRTALRHAACPVAIVHDLGESGELS
ncbi:universal stress protein [Actinoplanes sp. L3-i22]|uniref:universal stress protein n=1 Tax=Actinoplanes sp. L3-i22 TaxID=2836373 RepID=UPI001C7960A8|nr:universal stress protein [Actinoplanes sp. L3-i22]BCY09405.1 universal stress protein [Actinoplanes sp. L3-i22]